MLGDTNRSDIMEEDADGGWAGVAALARRQIEQLCAEYLDRTDHADGAPVADLFIETGTLILGSLAIEGRSAIERFFIERKVGQTTARRLTRHIASAPVIRFVGPRQATVRATVIVYAGEGDLPLRSGPPSTVCDFIDCCVRDDDGRWRFASRRADVIFTGNGAPSFALAESTEKGSAS